MPRPDTEHTALLRQAPKAPLRRLWDYARVHWRMLVLRGVLTFLGGITGLAQPLMAKYVIDALGEGGSVSGPILALLAVEVRAVRAREEELERIAGMVVRSASVRASEIENIVNHPALFDKVRLRINDGPKRPSGASVVLGFIRRNAAAVSGVLLISIAAIAFGVLWTKSPETVTVPVVAVTTETKPPSYTTFNEPDTLVEPRSIPSIERPRPRRISVGRVPGPRISRRKPSSAADNGGDFYAVSYAGDRNEMERGGRIIRVDMPRSALFAMGVNIPLENDAEVVKADLLVGNDGVTRAIRVVE